MDSYGMRTNDSHAAPLIASVISTLMSECTVLGRTKGQLVPGHYKTAAGRNVTVVNVSASVSPSGFAVVDSFTGEPIPILSPVYIDAGKVCLEAEHNMR